MNKAKKPWDGGHHQNYGKGGENGIDYCVRCGRKIKDDEEVVGLELNSHTGEWAEHNNRTLDGGTWGAQSQGWFNFGATCARRTMNEQHDRKMAEMRARRTA